MNQIPLYQHPFVDVFKITKLTDWSLSQKEGDVQEVYDKELAKTVIKISGASSASNYIQVPASKNLPKKALGLVGKYNLNGNSLQIPLTIQGDKWTMYVLNVGQLLEENKVFIAGSKSTFFMRSFQVTANCFIRGVFTSDIKYTLNTLPKDMGMKFAKNDFFSMYNWQEYPPSLSEEQLNEKENITSNKAKPKPYPKSIKNPPQKKSVKFNQDTQKPQTNKDLEEVREVSEQSDQDFYQVEEELKQSEQRELQFQKTQQKTVDEINIIKQEFHYIIEQKHLEPKADIILYNEETKPVNKIFRTINSKEDQKFILRPNPIMRLDRVIGMHPRYQAQQIFYNKDPKLSKELIYCQANLLLAYYPPAQRQRLFYDHQTGSLEFLHVEANYAFTASRAQKGENKDFEIGIWEVDQCQLIVSFKPPLISLHSITLSRDLQYLCLSGKDFQKRDLILIYNYSDLVKYKKVDILARQLSDFDIVNLRFNAARSDSLISCGKENIRFFKIKNNHLPSNSVILNNTARGKIFNNSFVDFKTNEKDQKTPTYVYVTTNCGLLYFVNYQNRQVDKIIQIHEDKVTSLVFSQSRDFAVTTSVNGIIRIWSNGFSKLISEVNTYQAIASCDINSTEKEIAILSTNGVISILDLELSSFNTIMRSHEEDITGLTYNKFTNRVASISNDNSIKLWNAESMEVENEFVIQNDLPTKICSNPSDCMIAVGFKSGFLRVFDLQQNKQYMEIMIFDSPIMDIQYSYDNKFLAIFHKNSSIVIFNIEKDYQPIKTIDYEYPNSNYFSLAFSYNSKYLANISSNANTITIWETKNFSLKFHLDLTGEIIQKIAFAPNDKDFIVLTTSSKLRFYRIGFNELTFIKDAYGVTDVQCQDFHISPNNKFIVFCGKEGVIKVYDYFMRGESAASSQAFLGHLNYPQMALFQDDMRYLFSIGQGNGIFKWSFMGEKEWPADINQYFEQLEEKKDTLKDEQREPIFKNDELETYTQQQLKLLQTQLANAQPYGESINLREGLEGLQHTFGQNKTVGGSLNQIQQQTLIQYNQHGYQVDQYDIQLKKVLACSTGNDVNNNIVWNNERRYIAYTSQNIVIVEDLNQEKTQRLLKEGNDKFYQLKMSPNRKMLLAYTKTGNIDGFPCIFIWDSTTLKKLNQIAISDQELVQVEFSPNSNMLLVISRSSGEKQSEATTTISIWDFLDGCKDILCKSNLPFAILDGRWNSYVQGQEFVTISPKKYHYWKISNNLTLQYQEGDIPKKGQDPFPNKNDQFTTLEFVVPSSSQVSFYMLLGLNNGYTWVVDARVNQFLYQAKVIDHPVRFIYTSKSRIVFEGYNDTMMHCWRQGVAEGFDHGDPNSFFVSKEVNLNLDGYPTATSYDQSGTDFISVTTSGTLWFCSWDDMATIKLKSCHSPHHDIKTTDFKYLPPGQFQINQEQDQFYQFDQNYLIASSGKDGIIKLWNLYDLEFQLQFIVPKEECVCIAMHQFKPFMVTAFTDGFLRFFDISKTKNLGRCKVNNVEDDDNIDYVIQMKILPSGNHIMASTKNGQVLLVYVQSWEPLSIKLEALASINTTINQFDISFLEPYNKWLVGTSNGKVIVYNRKDFNSFQQEIFTEDNPPKFNFMDSFNILDYVDNNFTETKRCNTLDHYYSVSKRNVVFNEVVAENECEGHFSNNDLALFIGFIKKCNFIFIRNFELHQVIKRIELGYKPISLNLLPNSSFFICLQQDGMIKMVDMVNEENSTEVSTIHEEAKMLQLCPNGKYVMTGGNKGDICVWSLKKIQPQFNEEYE